MRRFFCLLAALVIILSMAVPVFAVDLQGGYYFVANCALGSGIKFYVPADYMDRCLAYDSSGDLFNLTGSTIYLYSPDYPSYTFSASRFSNFHYRTGTGYGSDSQDLRITSVKETNIKILSDDPGISLGNDQLLLLVVVLLVLLIGCMIVCVRR